MRMHLLLIALVWSISPTETARADTLSQGAIPNGEQAHSVEARTDFRAGRYADAAAIYQAMAELHSTSLFAWSNLGITLFQMNKLKEARAALQHAVDLAPKDAPSQTVLGITHYELGSFPEAIDHLKAAIAINPNDATSHNYLGDSYEAAGMKVEAKAERALGEALEEQAVEPKVTPPPRDPKVGA